MVTRTNTLSAKVSDPALGLLDIATHTWAAKILLPAPGRRLSSLNGHVDARRYSQYGESLEIIVMQSGMRSTLAVFEETLSPRTSTNIQELKSSGGIINCKSALRRPSRFPQHNTNVSSRMA